MANPSVDVDFRGNANDINAKIANIEASLGTFASNAKKLVGAAIGAFAIKKLAGFASETIDLANTQIQAETKLAAAIKATGGASGFTVEQLKAQASALQEVTLYGDEVTLGAQQILTKFQQIKGDQFTEATKAAQNLATAMGTDLKGSAELVGKALNDPVRGMMMLRRQGVEFSDDQKIVIENLVETGRVSEAQAIILDKLEGSFGGMAEAAAKAGTGPLTQLKNRLGDIGEKVGGVVIKAFTALEPVMSTILGVFEGLIGTITDSDTTLGSFVQGGVQFLIDGFQLLVKIGVATFTGLQVAMENWKTVALLVLNGVLLTAVSSFEGMKHFLGTVLPTYLAFLFDNWRDIFTDIANVTTTIVSNMWDNLVSFFTGVWAWLNGDELDFEWKGLTEGFESSLKELPKIAEREIGPFEQALKDKVGELGGKLGNAYAEKYAENLAAVGLGPDAKPASVGEKPQLQTHDFAAEAAAVREAKAKEEEAKKKEKEAKSDKAKAEEKSQESGSAKVGEDLMSLYNRIAGAAAQNNAEEMAKKTADATERTAKATEASLTATTALASGVGGLAAAALTLAKTGASYAD